MSRHAAAAVLATLVAVLAHPSGAHAQSPFIQSAVPSETAQTITIRGVNLGAVPPDVYLNFTPLTVQSSSPTQVVAALPAPPLAPGTYSLFLIVGGTQFVASQVTLGGVGGLTGPPAGNATTGTGFSSAPLTLAASAFNSAISLPELQRFRWQVDPLSNNTANPGARMRLFFGSGAAAPAATGLAIFDSGLMTFAPGQSFPGVLTGVQAGQGLIATGAAPEMTLSVGNNQITGAMIGPGQVQISNLGFNPATQAELDAHTKHTKLVYAVPAADNSPITTFTSLLSVGTFTKDRAASDIVLNWTGTVSKLDFPFAANFCEFQLRIDGNHDGSGSTGAARARPIGEFSTSVSVTGLFTGLGAGLHSVSIYSRGDAASCRVNFLLLPETVIVTESGG